MDELIIFIVAFFPFSIVFYFIYTVIKGNGGSKGITEEYTSKSGVIRTAKKSREEHIVWIGWLTLICIVQCALKSLLRIEREN